MDDYDRRAFIKTSIPGFLGVTLALPAINAFALRANACEGRITENTQINWDAYLEKITKLAAQQHLDNWNEENYVKQVVQVAKTLNLKDPVLQAGFAKALKGVENGRVDFNTLEENHDFAVCLLDFQEGEKISPHDHPSMTGVIQCASGEIQVDNYDEQEVLENGNLLLKNVSSALLKEKSISTLTSKKRNIHTLVAKKPTQLVDIFTPPYDKERVEKSRWFTIDDELYKGKESLYEAVVR